MLQITESPGSGRIAKGGCGIKIKVEESDLLILAGSESEIQISFGFSAAMTIGDTFEIHGQKYTVVAGAPTATNEIGIAFTTAEIVDRFNLNPIFLYNYTLTTGASNSVIITANKNGVDERFSFSATTTNLNAIELTPAGLFDQGVDDQLKEDYKVLLDVLDSSGNRFCSEPLDMDLSVFENYDNAACFDLEDVIANLPNVYTAFPLPRQTIAQGLNLPTNFDENYLGDFEICIYNSYRNPNGETCDRIQDSFECIDLLVANMLQPKEYNPTSGIFIDLYRWNIFGNTEFITNMPNDYKICKDTAFELRFDLDNDTIINSFAGASTLEVRANYTDGTTDTSFVNIEDDRNGIHVANISLTGANATISLPSIDKEVSSIFVRVFFDVGGGPVVLCEKTILIDNTARGRCCGGCSRTFYFLGSLGNNDVMVSRCESDIDLELEFYETCREVKCEGEVFWGIHQYSGKIQNQVTKREKIYKVYFEADNSDYLEEFFVAPVKYVEEDGNVYRIFSTNNTFKIYQKNQKARAEFTYYKSISPLRQSLTK